MDWEFPLWAVAVIVAAVYLAQLVIVAWWHERRERRRRDALPPLYFNVRLRDGTFLYDKEE